MKNKLKIIFKALRYTRMLLIYALVIPIYLVYVHYINNPKDDFIQYNIYKFSNSLQYNYNKKGNIIKSFYYYLTKKKEVKWNISKIKQESRHINYIINNFKRDMNYYNKDLSKFHKLGVIYNDSIWAESFAIAYCLDDKLVLTNNYFRLPYNRKKKIFYHEMGHCLFNYAHHHYGIMSYRPNQFHHSNIRNFFQGYNQNYLTIFKNKTNPEIWYLNTKILFMPLNSSYQNFNHFFHIQKSNLIRWSIQLIVFIIFLFDLKGIFKPLFFSRKNQEEYIKI